MIKEDGADNSELIPCYVQDIITKDIQHELGIKVRCKDNKIGRVKHIGNESSLLTSNELLIKLEKKIRKVIIDRLSKEDADWWQNKIAPIIRQDVDEKLRSRSLSKQPDIPSYKLIEYTNFSHLPKIIVGKNWKFFEEIFRDKNGVLTKLNELLTYRNLSAHANDLTENIEKKIQVYYDDITQLIECYYNKN